MNIPFTSLEDLKEKVRLKTLERELAKKPVAQVKAIPLADLTSGWYQGEGWFIGGIAYWTADEEVFVGLDYAFGRIGDKRCNYGEMKFMPTKKLLA